MAPPDKDNRPPNRSQRRSKPGGPGQSQGGRGGRKGREQPQRQAPASDFSMKLVATCALGLELSVGRELESLGLGPIQRDNAQVSFPYSPRNLAKANYWLRTADRVWLQLAEFPCRDFEELFRGVKAIDWPELMPQDAHFPVEVISTKSKLESLSSCQAVAKKAAVEKMQSVYEIATFPETGSPYAIR
ncbi:MAG: THUMP domain-containing protein, partial [Vulcanimicrobiota bacterium]